MPFEITGPHQTILEDALEHLERNPPELPRQDLFRVRHEAGRALIDELVTKGFLAKDDLRYRVTLKGLVACDMPKAALRRYACRDTLKALQGLYRAEGSRLWTIDELASRLNEPPHEVVRNLTLLQELGIASRYFRDSESGLAQSLTLSEGVLDVDIPTTAQVSSWAPERLQLLEVAGYRPFSDLHAELGKMTVIIGANGTGKSSLFDFLQFVAFAATNPIPFEIDPNSAGKQLFHSGGPEAIQFALEVAAADGPSLRYEVDLRGPVGKPRVALERLSTAGPEYERLHFLSATGGSGGFYEPAVRIPIGRQWTIPDNELALRRALNPANTVLPAFLQYVTSWRFYSALDVSASAPVRRPVQTETGPVLAKDGSNLSAVLHALALEHQEAFAELETHLRSAVPGFTALKVRPYGGKGTVMAFWQEQGVNDELSLADLSDGTLRFLCWATLCLSPNLPPLICLDEPELGLHPRVLPILAGLLRLASSRTQVLVSTHSPYFLSQFSLEEIAVLRKDEGHAVLLRPSSSRALSREIEEIGGEALVQLHLSDELEARA